MSFLFLLACNAGKLWIPGNLLLNLLYLSMVIGNRNEFNGSWNIRKHYLAIRLKQTMKYCSLGKLRKPKMCQNTPGKPPTQVVGAAEIMELERTESVKRWKVWNVRCSGEVCGAQTLRCTCGSNADSSRHTGPVTRSNWILFSLPTSQDLVICSQRCCLFRARHCTS